MFRFLARLIGGLLLALAVVFAVGDIARSLTEDALYFTPFAEALGSVGLEAPSEAAGEGALPAAADLLWTAVEDWPAAPTFGILALLFLLIGRPKPRGRERLVR